jgi:hypothetical protein
MLLSRLATILGLGQGLCVMVLLTWGILSGQVDSFTAVFFAFMLAMSGISVAVAGLCLAEVLKLRSDREETRT